MNTVLEICLAPLVFDRQEIDTEGG